MPKHSADHINRIIMTKFIRLMAITTLLLVGNAKAQDIATLTIGDL